MTQTKLDEKKLGSDPLAWMAQRPIAANLLMIILLGGGIWASLIVQKEVMPQFLLDVVEIEVGYPGAAPEEVEQAILMPIEENIKAVAGIKEITSTAREGRGSVAVELVAGTDRIKAFQEIDQAMSRIQSFPEDIDEPEVQLQDRRRDVMEIVLYGAVDPWQLRNLAENLRNQLKSHPLLNQVELDDPLQYVAHVEVSQNQLQKYNLSLTEIADRIASSSSSIPAGALETDAGEILLRLDERKKWAEELSDVIVISSASGGGVRLGDIADVSDGFARQGFHSQFNGTPSSAVAVYRLGSISPMEVADAVDEVLKDFVTTLPDGVSIRIDGNRAKDYYERLHLLLENGFLAIIIVLIILSMFLEWKVAFWVMMGMTISFVGSILVLPMIGVSINMISMFGFLVVLGIVVDDAVVVGENIYEYRSQGFAPLEAAIKGVKDIAGPVTFSILTSCVAFLPLLFIPGTTGKFWWPLPAVVITVLLISLVEALIILPAHLTHGNKAPKQAFMKTLHSWQRNFAAKFDHFVNTQYRSWLETCIRFRYVTLSAAVGLLIVAVSYAGSAHMGMIMMPEVAADEIEAGVRLPVGITIDQAGAVAEEVTRATQVMFEKHDLDRVAEGIKTNVRRQSFVDVEIVMRPPDERDMSAAEVIRLWRDQIGDIKGVDQITFEAERGPGGWQQDISIDLSHENIDILALAGRDLLAEAKRFQETSDVSDNYRKGKKQFDFTLRPQAYALGLTPAMVGEQLRAGFFGALAKRELRGSNEVEVRVKLPIVERQDINRLQDFMIKTPDGSQVPLASIVQLHATEGFSSSERRNGQRVVNVGMDVEPKRSTNMVLTSLKEDVLPKLRATYPGLTWSFQGSGAEMRESTQMLWGGFSLAMMVIYALLAIAFNSYSQPLIVMAAIPFGVVGAILGHMILGYDLSLVSLMGLIALSGVVVNDALIMISYANQKRDSLPTYRAISEAGLRRFRPIFLTTITTFAGLTPIILETSSQARHLIPMAISLGFGILFATAITLVIVPCLYLGLEDLERVLQKSKKLSFLANK